MKKSKQWCYRIQIELGWMLIVPFLEEGANHWLFKRQRNNTFSQGRIYHHQNQSYFTFQVAFTRKERYESNKLVGKLTVMRLNSFKFLPDNMARLYLWHFTGPMSKLVSNWLWIWVIPSYWSKWLWHELLSKMSWAILNKTFMSIALALRLI